MTYASPDTKAIAMLGFNTGYVEELYRQYLENPESVSPSWRDFFADYKPSESFRAAAEARSQVATVVAAPPAAPPPPAGDGASVKAVEPPSAEPEPAASEDVKPIRGPAAMIVENMEASISVPTATSVKTFPVKLMAENRKAINDFQRDVGGEKISYTHLIAWAVVTALKEVPNMYTSYRQDNGTPQHVIPRAINLGLAIDVEKRGRRSLIVPNIKNAGAMTFPQFVGIYNDLIRRSREGKLELSDFKGTTATITNPGMIGTSLSVPRLMPGQGVIVGVGAIGFPPEYHAFAPGVISKTGISQVMTITSTYDHRVIQGAESGAFLKLLSQLLLGDHDFFRNVFSELGIPFQPYSLTSDSTPQVGGVGQDEMEMTRKQARVLQLIRAYRVRGHLQADVNPLGHEWEYHPELDPSRYGLTVWDLDREFITGGIGPSEILPLREILDILRNTYTRKIGVEYMHISDPMEKQWLQEKLEPVHGYDPLSESEKTRVMAKLNAAEAFERFLHTKYIGHKRFSLEGADSVIPMIDIILSDAAEQEVRDVVIGMAHRGRLNVLANIFEKPYELIFSEFEGNLDPNTTQGSGDVKYHLGASGVHHSAKGLEVSITLSANPSHLEAVNPVVEGMVRAKQDRLKKEDADAPGGDHRDVVIPLLIHGDAAFAGQGVVSETLNLSQLPGYNTGGTVHIVINNQIGFTTTAADARSSTYATDVARMIQAPIFHVNGDDPEACVRVARLALDFRQVFNKDVVIDLVCYRVHGHNEGDEPTFTQPLLYRRIEAKRSVRKLYTESLLRRGEVEPEQAEKMMDDYRSRLQDAFDQTRELGDTEPDVDRDVAIGEVADTEGDYPDTSASKQDLEDIIAALKRQPEGFATHPKLARLLEKRAKLFHEEESIDWGVGEALAFGAIVLDGHDVRLAGQDSQRGTFSHRHGVLVDQENGDEYIPLNHIRDQQAQFRVYDSLLSEYAACGFEYGYSIAKPEALVIWEAQFGDFANGAQIVYDQFLSAGDSKWGTSSSLVLMLPHGYEGQGPEHSSARLERFLQMCAEGNMRVCNLTTPANLFHALRRQVKSAERRPLVIMTPKSLLRHPLAVSHPSEFMEGSVKPVIVSDADPSLVERHVLCSGKVFYDIVQGMTDEQRSSVAVTRLEQLYPFPASALRDELDRFASAAKVVWAQEEPANMGGWSFVRPRLEALLAEVRGEDCPRVEYVGRSAAASPSTGSAKIHQLEQTLLVETAIGQKR